MNDEIKEIIRLNCEEEIEVKYFAKDDSIVDTTMDYSQLLDYITNLQEELQESNESITWWANRFNAVERDKKDYKSRIDKAIEYIKNDWYELNTRDIEHCINFNKDIRIDLLNILKGSDE